MKLYQREQVYALDKRAIENDAQPGRQLMQKAALAVWRAIQGRWAGLSRMVILAGPGNNGGDAFAVALLAMQDGVSVDLLSVGDLSNQSAESAFYRKLWLDSGGTMEAWSGYFPDCDLIVDGMLGIGLDRHLNEEWQNLIAAINQHPSKRVCIDIPSGLNANTGTAMPCAVRADLTVTFIARKVGCFVADGPDYCGELVFDALGLSINVSSQQEALLQVLDETSITLPAQRKINSHKNQFGHVLVIGGNKGMSGAVRLSGMAALRSGAGLVTACVHADNVSAVAASHAELMVRSWDDLPALLELASVVVIGPGLGRCDHAARVLELLVHIDRPMVIDADALNADFVSSLSTATAVLTPHPGEAARLLNSSTSEIQGDRVLALQAMLDKWRYACVLKGSGSLTGDKDGHLSICHRGHAGMATAGMGDVLSGMVAGYLAQSLSVLDALETAVFIHALAAENYAQHHDENSLIASDIIHQISGVTRYIKKQQSVS